MSGRPWGPRGFGVFRHVGTPPAAARRRDAQIEITFLPVPGNRSYCFCLPQFQVDSLPPPRGFVHDFAGVIPAATVARLEPLLRELQRKTRGDIAVVTLPDLGGCETGDVGCRSADSC